MWRRPRSFPALLSHKTRLSKCCLLDDQGRQQIVIPELGGEGENFLYIRQGELTFHERQLPTKCLSLFHTTAPYYNASGDKKSYPTCCLLLPYILLRMYGTFREVTVSARRVGEDGLKKKEIFFSSFFRQRLNVPSGWEEDALQNEQKREADEEGTTKTCTRHSLESNSAELEGVFFELRVAWNSN